MKKRPSECYLVISSAHLGMSDDVLQVYSRVAKEYKAKVIHLGPLVTDKEFSDYQRTKEKITKLKDAVYNAETESQHDKAAERLEDSKSHLTSLLSKQAKTIGVLKGHFSNISFVTTDEMHLPTNIAKITRNGVELSKYLFLSPVPPRTDKATGGINQNSISYLTELGKSWIVAHPVPEVRVFPKPGLNEAYNYYTVGSLKKPGMPTKTSNQYEFAHMPCAILVVLDKQNGEFHANQLHIDYIGKTKAPAVIHDGLIFLSDKIVTAKSPDKSTMGTDYHAPYQHPGVVAAHRATNQLHQPGTLIDGGDMGSFESVSHWLENKPGESEGLRLIDDINALRRLMDALDNVDSIKEKILIESNHHNWLSDYVEKNPALKGLVDWDTLAVKFFSDWKVFVPKAGDNLIYKFGDTLIRHGDKDGGPKGKFQFIKYVCGHWHKFASWRRSIGLGCGAKLGPKYVGNDITAWQSQIAVLTKYNDVTGTIPKIVLHSHEQKKSRFSYQSQIFEVDYFTV